MLNKILYNVILLFLLLACNSGDNSAIDKFVGGNDPVAGDFGNSYISFTPTSHNFGTEYVGDTSSTKEFELKNVSSSTISIDNIAADESSFSITANNCSSLAPAATCSISIQFAPASSESYSASAIASYEINGSSVESSVGFTGVGVANLVFAGIDSISNLKATTLTTNWTHVAGAVSYLVFTIDGGGNRTFKGSTNAPSASLDIAGLSEGTTYTFEVQAMDLNSGVTNSTNQVIVTTVAMPVLTTINDGNFPINNLTQNIAMTTIDINNTNTGDDSNMVYSCYFDKVIDNSVAAITPCIDLPGTATFSTGTGVFDWTPNNNSFGAYEFIITGTVYTQSSDSEIFVLDVRSNYTQNNLVIDLDTQFTNYTNAIDTADTNNSWLNIFITGASYDGFLYGAGLSDSWQGDGTFLAPYSLAFDGMNNNYVDLGTGINTNADLMFSMWIKPSASAELDKVILGNKGNGGDGFELKQSADNANKLQLRIGTLGAIASYDTRVLSYSPVAYYRFDETTGTVNATDSSANTNTGAYAANVALEQAGGVAGNDAVRFDGSATSYIDVADDPTLNFTATGFTFSSWVYLEATANYRSILGKGTNPYDYLWTFKSNTRRHSLYMGTANQTWDNTNSSDIPLNTWTHIAVSFNPGTKKLQYYTNGVPDGDYTTASSTMINSGAILEIGSMINHAHRFIGSIDELVMYNSVLTDTEVLDLYSATAINCESTSSMVDGVWTNVAATYESGSDTAKLYINGAEECSAIYGNTFQPASTALTMGARSDGTNAWTGSIANLKLYSAVSAGDIPIIFSETRTPFIDVGNIVTDNLVLNLNPAIPNGTNFPGLGCAYTSWVDLSDNAFTGTLNNFAGCDTESGWNGDGSALDPYRLDLNRTAAADYISFPDHNNLDITGDISFSFWIKPDSITTHHGLIGKGTAQPFDYLLNIPAGTQRVAYYNNNNKAWTNTSNTNLSTANWQHIVMSFNATTGDLNYYYNGAADGYYSLNPGANPVNTAVLEIGTMINNAWPFDGSIGNLQIYNAALTADEAYQNCTAHASNFSGVVCTQ